MNRSRSVGLIGCGAIGASVAEQLLQGAVPGYTLLGVVSRSTTPPRYPAMGLDRLLDRCDVVIEAAGHAALTEHGPRIRDAGIDLIVASVGALADDTLRTQLWAAGPGRLILSSGAIGGLDVLQSAALGGGLDEVHLTTTKPSHVLRQSWMDKCLVTALTHGKEPVTAFEGPARRAVDLFPTSVNVAATLALATLGFDRTRVRVVGDPGATVVEHRITAAGRAGEYEFIFRNNPARDNPRTSGIVPYAMLRSLRDLSATVVVGG